MINFSFLTMIFTLLVILCSIFLLVQLVRISFLAITALSIYIEKNRDK